MKQAKLLITGIVISLNLNFLQAQEYVLRFQNITTKQGLSDNRITDVLQDSKGLLWAASKLAINKYNGKESEHYILDDEATVNHLLEDKQGNIWAATTKGLFIYNLKENVFFKLKTQNKDFNDLINENILKLIEVEEDGTFWFLCNSALASFKIDSYFNIDEQTQKIITNKTPFSFTALIEDHNHILWLGNNAGEIYKYDDHTITKQELSKTIAFVGINDIVMDKTNNLWIATNGDGLFRFNTTDGDVTHFQSQTANDQTITNPIVLCLLVDEKDNIWIGTDGGGLNLFQKKSHSFHFFKQSFNNHYSISDNSILSIRHGLDNTILTSTVHGGICIFKNDLDMKRISPDKLGFNYKDEQSSTILEDNDKNIWLSAGRDGLRKYNPQTQQLTSFIDDPNNSSDLSGSIVLSLMEDEQKRIWIGTLRGGLNIYNTKQNRFIPNLQDKDTRRIYTIATATDGRTWVGSSDGIRVYDAQLNIIDRIQVASKFSAGNNIKTLYKDIKGDMWVGTEHGLHRYQKNAKGYSKQSYYANPQDTTSLVSNHILSITETDDLSLMIGTYGHGVNVYSRTTNAFQKLRPENTIDGTIIRGILKDGHHNIWFSTNAGLSRMSADGSVINLTTNEGVQAFNGGAATLGSNGSILMAGSQGLTYFYPQELQLNASLPKVFFTSASIIKKHKESDDVNYNLKFDQPIVTEPIELTNNTASCTINFSSSYLYAPEDLKYAYKLEGLNDTWQMIENNRSLTFSSLSPGDYTLMIKVANEFGKWSPNLASLKIKVIPSFWQKKSTKLIIVLLLISLLVFFYKWRVTAIKKQKERLQRLLQIKTEEVKKQQDEVYQGKIAVLHIEKMNQKLNQKKLKDELKFKIDELTNHTLRTVHKNNLLSDIREKLNAEIKLSKADKQNLKNIVSLINDSLILDKDWKSFYSIFNQVHPTFIKDLKDHSTKLSERDIQLCALIKLNFSSQHIATLFAISLSSVKVARHRLRKKLNIQEGNTLKGFLSEFSNVEN